MSPAEGGERVGGTDGVAVTPFAVDLGAGVFGDGIVADDLDRALGNKPSQDGGDVPACQPASGPPAEGENAVITAGVARGQGAQAAEQVGDGASAHGEDGGQGQHDEALIGRSGQGRGQRLEDGVDRLGELAIEPLELASAQAGLTSPLAALFPGEPFLAASAQVRRLGTLMVRGPDGLARFFRGQPLAGSAGYTGHGSLLGCDGKVGSYPSLHRGGPPPWNPKNGKSRTKSSAVLAACLRVSAVRACRHRRCSRPRTGIDALPRAAPPRAC